MKTKKLLSLLLALMMMLSVVPMYASAAEAEALTNSNITQYPTISFKNADGKFYAGQTVGDGLILNDDEIVTDANGNQVAGHFEFIDLTANITLSGSGRADIKFVPDDETAYIGFEFPRCRYVTYPITKTTPVFIDENDTVPVATEVEPGATLSTSILSGAKVKNPYNESEPKALAASWEWTGGSTTTVVNESGYYEARLSISSGYEMLTAQVYVKVKGNAESTEIIEAPTLKNLELGKQWKDVTFEGGKAVVKGGTEEVTGNYSITRIWQTPNPDLNTYVFAGENIELELTFKPDDTEKYLSSTTTVTVTVNKAPIKFVDENGADVVPEYTIPYGYTLNNYEAPIFAEFKKYLNTGSEEIRLYFSEEDSRTMFDAGTYELTIGAAPYYTTSNYLKNDNLKVKLTVEPKALSPKINGSTEGSYIVDSSGTYRVKGTFDIYVDDELVHSGIKYLEDKFELTFPENVTATYTVKIVYNPVENDNFVMNDIIYQKTVIANRNLTFKGGVANYKLGNDTLSKSIKDNESIAALEGNTVAFEANSDDFAEWIITDTNGNVLDLDIKTVVTNVDENGGVTFETVDGDLSCENIIFTMPTEDIIITQRTTKDIAAENCDHICHSDNPLFQMLWKLISFICRLFDIQQYCDCGVTHW